MSIARHHAEWLSLVEVSGPFLSLPVLMRAFPQGLEDIDPTVVQQLRSAYDEWQEALGHRTRAMPPTRRGSPTSCASSSSSRMRLSPKVRPSPTR